MSDAMKYLKRVGAIPRRVSEGRVLAHNHLRHTVDMPHGLFGFRCWTWPKGKVPDGFVECPCGWAGLPHVVLYSSSGKCVSWDEIAISSSGDEVIQWVPSDLGIGFDLSGSEAAIGAELEVETKEVQPGQYDRLVPMNVIAGRPQILVLAASSATAEVVALTIETEDVR